ncbi:fibroblast growth factor 1 isoform X2 [Callorhinchus milii]|uniref:fibroblast growth factor 1 isoform X2 n=1 Tax=Callorhinchus milii TaxID=7868 RepID=UPI000457197E|nr:fibroblast growth factor 1 isoform X2 [Callorhinchus milii]|eukprot:gi/632967801/ref/XP_007900181.1/ PREDICTED: fibroblast growth factor 1 isoform X2 [Callorhinchus milii]
MAVTTLADLSGSLNHLPGCHNDPKLLYCENGGYFIRILPDGTVEGTRDRSDISAPVAGCECRSGRDRGNPSQTLPSDEREGTTALAAISDQRMPLHGIAGGKQFQHLQVQGIRRQELVRCYPKERGC